ncbi:metal ABC transporter substrate-binding protein [Enterococcus casseliflavus]|uniref:metal ABC transporter substrate-binding protein n=1 Tax=Enterococcus casseliflavus TaxID=37734 RepID=UPI0018833260|nr:metal ABC transporter substrate-binding protein [Enterococcus casseliflavus]MBE9908884.1 zinc ABC transporter substrate-binding protein [Enterococcus casseliflavus]
MKKMASVILMLLSTSLFAACGNQVETTNSSNASSESNQIEVVATFYPMYEFTKAVVGEEGQVDLLIPAGNEPHEYEPSAQDMTKISDADAFVFNSQALEKWASNGLDSVDQDKTKVIEAAKGIALSESDPNSEEAGELDPHVWLDPVLAQKEVQTIEEGLAEKFPDKAEAFKKNADAYIEQLSDLDEEYQAAFKDAKNRSFVTQHAAFGYLAKEYDLKQEAISGISPEEEPSAARLAELKTFVESNEIKIIYFEENATSKVAETLADETSVQTEVLSPIEGITQEDMDDGVTYISIMKDNLKSLAKTIK